MEQALEETRLSSILPKLAPFQFCLSPVLVAPPLPPNPPPPTAPVSSRGSGLAFQCS